MNSLHPDASPAVPTISYDVLIVGAGHGGAQAATLLRQAKFGGTIAIVGDEPELPYERPPLSKEYLSGEKAFERLLIRPASFWQDRSITILTGRRVTAVDPDSHQICCDDGAVLGYGQLVWAAGGVPRRLDCPGGDLEGVHTVRTRADVDRMLTQLQAVRKVAVIGGGYIGLEAAAVLTGAGKRVIVFEALDRVLARIAGEPLSRFYEVEHRAHGVEIRLSAKIKCIEGDDRRVSAVRLADGSIAACDMVIVGIGITPSVRPLLAAGAHGGNGVAVDAQCRTSLPDIFAIGDCALHSNRFADGAAVRLESVQNANDQASVVAKVITGAEASYDSVPWFWSNQYDLKLQTVGLSSGYDALAIRGRPEERSFSIVYFKRGRVIALDCVNSVKDYVQGRRLVAERAEIDPTIVANASIPLKEIKEPGTTSVQN